MTFLDLAPEWADQPLTDPTLAADVVDLMVSDRDRRNGTFTAILCGPDARFRAVVAIDLPEEFAEQDLPLDPPGLCATAMHPLVLALRSEPGSCLLLALGRPGPPTWPEVDDEWSTAAHHLCQAAQVPLLAFYIATPDHIYQPLLANSNAA
ncbi:hypothetical protein GCM10029976_097600 [Kribbella albertanoniae]|uniref:Uncharacterized protein n=1 Tax=Kribbella albertanoniae TaxID=1266829 RepID=A0A4R4QDW7_9ACTN|nr:hypothetical protein [Kribbella albertanoniae]TDC33292.1 hypothetical protein E1261_06425 [Kribbella albertanoniae]